MPPPISSWPHGASIRNERRDQGPMARSAQNAPPSSPPVLAKAEVSRRMLLLAELQGALARRDIHSVLARNHRLVLQYKSSPCQPSGLTDPRLYIFLPGGTDSATTDGTSYHLAIGRQYLASDPAAAADLILHGQHAASRA
jgi:hypothetical protein